MNLKLATQQLIMLSRPEASSQISINRLNILSHYNKYCLMHKLDNEENYAEDIIISRQVNPISTLSQDIHYIDAIVAVDQKALEYILIEYYISIGICQEIPFLEDLGYCDFDWQESLLRQMNTWDDPLEDTFGIKFRFHIAYDYEAGYDESDIRMHPRVEAFTQGYNIGVPAVINEDALRYTYDYDYLDTEYAITDSVIPYNNQQDWANYSYDSSNPTNQYAMIITLNGYMRDFGTSVHGNWLSNDYRNIVVMQYDHPFWTRSTTFCHEVSHAFGAQHNVTEPFYLGGDIVLNESGVPDGSGPANVKSGNDPDVLWNGNTYNYDLSDWYRDPEGNYPYYDTGLNFDVDASVMNYYHACFMDRIDETYRPVRDRTGWTWMTTKNPIKWDWYNSYLIKKNIEKFDYVLEHSDPDHDGLKTYLEDQIGTDPFDSDTDDDGLSGQKIQ